MDQQTPAAAPLGQKNAVEIFLNALEKSCRSARLYSYASGADVMESIYDNTLGALERAFAESDEIEVSVKPFEMVFERKVVYANKEKKSSMSFALYNDGIRMMTFKRGMNRQELLDIIQVLATDFSKPEMMDIDLYCLFADKGLPHMEVVGADILGDLFKEDVKIKDAVENFLKETAVKKKEVKTTNPRKLRSDDLKVLEEFRLNPTQFTRSDAEVSKVIQSLTLNREVKSKEHETLERLLAMGFHFLLDEKDAEQRKIGRDLVVRVSLLIIGDADFGLLESLLAKIYQLQKDRYDQSGEFQKILDSIFSPDQRGVFLRVMSNVDYQQPLMKLFLQAPASAVRLLIVVLGEYPLFTRASTDCVLKNLPTYMTWLLEEVKARPESSSWEQVINILSSRPTFHFQKFLEALLESASAPIRHKIWKQLSVIGTPDALRTFELMLNSERFEDRKQAYEFLSQVKNKNSLKIVKDYLAGPKFAESDTDEKEVAYACIVNIGGEHSYPWVEALWLQPGTGLFKKKAETERRMILLRGLQKTPVDMIDRLLEKTPLQTLPQELVQMVEKLKQRNKAVPTTPSGEKKT